MKQTPLIDQHRAARAKLVDFAGWEMPIQYSGVVDEYQAVRRAVGLFDVSHMGRLRVTGAGALELLQSATTNDVAGLTVGQAQYSMVCNPQGGILDDIFVYRLKESEYLLCVNASNREKIFGWLQSQPRPSGVMIEDHSDRIAQIALQGPRSKELILSLGGGSIGTLKLHHACEAILASIPALVARTGYTGELGYELYVSADRIGALWDRLVEQGAPIGLKPAGLGSRDLLRLEMGYLLYGNDIDETVTPLEAGVEWTVRLGKGEFVGRAALLAQSQPGPAKRFVGFELLEKAVPRHGCKMLDAGSAAVIGDVSSGNLSPILQKGIGLGYVAASYAAIGTPIAIDIRGKVVPAKIVKLPFYKKPKPV